MKTFYLLRGVSGSGKSTFAKDLAQSMKGVYFENDTYHTDHNGVYDYQISRREEAQQWCFSQAVEAMRNGNPCVIVSNTSTEESAFDKFIEMAKIFGYRVVSLVVENRHGNNSVHNVPESIRGRQEEEIKRSLKLM